MTSVTPNHLKQSGTWNVHAREFTPSTAQSSPVALRLDAPEFVPISAGAGLKAQITELVTEAGIAGLRVSALPGAFRTKYEVPLDLSTSPFSDLSVLVRSVDGLYLDEAEGLPKSLSEAMAQAGFLVAPEDSATKLEAGIEEDDSSLPLGADADKTVRLCIFNHFVHDLSEFRQSIVDVIHNFYLKNGGTHVPLSGLALSLFAAEWDRYHTVRGISADLKTLRDRFGVVKLMPFLQAIPELDVVGTHPEVRVRIRPGVICRSVPSSPRLRKPTSWTTPTATPNSSTHDGFSTGGGPRNISLSSELFGEPSSVPSTPASLSAPEAQTRAVLEQMLASTQSQILGILSQVPSDPLAAAAAIEKMNELQVLVNALKAALAVLPPPSAKKPLSIETELFAKPQSAVTLNLDEMLSPHSAAAAAAPAVGPLLSDLSRILFAQVIQQQQPTAPETAAETSAALERTLHELVSAASSPPASPVNESSLLFASPGLVQGNLLIPKSLPTSPIPVHEVRESADDAATMHQLLRGLMGAMAPPGLEAAPPKQTPNRFVPAKELKKTDTAERVYSKAFLLALRERMTDLESPPVELVGLSCRHVLRAPPVKAPRVAAK